MELAHILEELAYDMGELPREAIEAAVAKRHLITPHLLQILEDAIDRIDALVEDECYQGHVYALYLLAQFREPRAYPLILRLFSYPGQIPHQIGGDVLTEDLCRILASVCNRCVEPIYDLIENPKINEYVRASGQSALVTLVGIGELPRKVVIDYFRTLFHERLERKPSFVWDNLISVCSDLYPEELYDEIFLAFAEFLVDPCFFSLESVGEILTHRKEDHLFRLFQNSDLIEDTVTEMEKWMTTLYEGII